MSFNKHAKRKWIEKHHRELGIFESELVVRLNKAEEETPCFAGTLQDVITFVGQARADLQDAIDLLTP